MNGAVEGLRPEAGDTSTPLRAQRCACAARAATYTATVGNCERAFLTFEAAQLGFGVDIAEPVGLVVEAFFYDVQR
jgi:hypothetical protein